MRLKCHLCKVSIQWLYEFYFRFKDQCHQSVSFVSLTHKAFRLLLVNNWKMTFAWSQNSPGPSHITSHALKYLSCGTFQGCYHRPVSSKTPFWTPPQLDYMDSTWTESQLLKVGINFACGLWRPCQAGFRSGGCIKSWYVMLSPYSYFQKGNNLQGKNAKKALYFAMTEAEIYIF